MPRARLYASDAERQAAYRERRAQEQGAEGSPLTSQRVMLDSKPDATNRWPRWHSLVQSVENTLSVVQTEMQAYYDTRSERWQDSEKAEEFQERWEALTEIQEQVREWMANR